VERGGGEEQDLFFELYRQPREEKGREEGRKRKGGKEALTSYFNNSRNTDESVCDPLFNPAIPETVWERGEEKKKRRGPH